MLTDPFGTPFEEDARVEFFADTHRRKRGERYGVVLSVGRKYVTVRVEATGRKAIVPPHHIHVVHRPAPTPPSGGIVPPYITERLALRKNLIRWIDEGLTVQDAGRDVEVEELADYLVPRLMGDKT